MSNNIQSVKNLSIGFKSQKGKEISILRNVTTNIKKGTILILNATMQDGSIVSKKGIKY